MIEAFNADFHLPVVMCGTMNCLPSSGTYEILCRGVEAQDPAKPRPAGKPSVEPLSTSSVRLRWAPPPIDSESLSPLVDKYKIVWVPGGSRFLSGESIDVLESNCLMYDTVETESGNARTVQNPSRSAVVTGLSSGVAYEFRVSAVNSLGQGPLGERSEPIRMPKLAGNDPEDKVLLGAASISVLRRRQLAETRHREKDRLADPRTYALRKLVKIHGLVDLDSEKLHPFDSVSGLTPRYSDALLHPDLANARTDAGFPIIQLIVKTNKTANVTPRRRRRAGRRRHMGQDHDTFSLEYAGGERSFEGSYGTNGSQSRVTTSESRTAEYSLLRSTATTTDEGNSTENWAKDMRRSEQELTTVSKSKHSGESPPQMYRQVSCEDVCSRLAYLKVTGARSTRQKHALGLRSAYMTYWSGGEPAFTTLSDRRSATVDYIFFSEQSLLPGEVLSMPEMGDLVSRDVRQTDLVPNPGSWKPSGWKGEPEEEGFEGTWSPYLGGNPKRAKHRIPNDVFPSDHLMLLANLYYFEPNCPSSWL